MIAHRFALASQQFSHHLKIYFAQLYLLITTSVTLPWLSISRALLLDGQSRPVKVSILERVTVSKVWHSNKVHAYLWILQQGTSGSRDVRDVHSCCRADWNDLHTKQYHLALSILLSKCRNWQVNFCIYMPNISLTRYSFTSDSKTCRLCRQLQNQSYR